MTSLKYSRWRLDKMVQNLDRAFTYDEVVKLCDVPRYTATMLLREALADGRLVEVDIPGYTRPWYCKPSIKARATQRSLTIRERVYTAVLRSPEPISARGVMLTMVEPVSIGKVVGALVALEEAGLVTSEYRKRVCEYNIKHSCKFYSITGAVA